MNPAPAHPPLWDLLSTEEHHTASTTRGGAERGAIEAPPGLPRAGRVGSHFTSGHRPLKRNPSSTTSR